MKVFLSILCFLFFSCVVVFPSTTINGVVEKIGKGEGNVVVDSNSSSPISGAKIYIPGKNYTVFSDADGKFSLDIGINGPTIISVEKEGYRPFSLTIDEKTLSKPIVIGIDQSNPKNLVIENDIFHIGDDSFSANSANSGDFKIKSIGPFYTRKVKIRALNPNETPVIVIGSIIGIDSLMSMNVGQSKVKNAYASPPEVYFNGSKIAEIQINGDNQEIKIPKNLIKANQENDITIKSGKNLFQHAYIDYDDIEFMNLFIDFK